MMNHYCVQFCSVYDFIAYIILGHEKNIKSKRNLILGKLVCFVLLDQNDLLISPLKGTF
jgi:hypothetical protein